MLGIWDGHDAGAALVRGDEIVFAIQEERLSRRKLDVGFPYRSIRACLDHAGPSPASVRHVALSTTDPAKTLTRLLPRLKEEYYLLRRRKKGPQRGDAFKKRFKYRFTELPPNWLSRHLSRAYAIKEIRAMGLRKAALHFYDHHLCHARAAASCSGFDPCLVITLDGVGDGLSGSIWRQQDGRLEPVKRLPANVSLGIFFEHVTNLMNMRELEDEGKVMALANYAYPIEDSQNPLIPLLKTRGLAIHSAYTSTRLFREMKKILWQYPSEQFAYMAQRALEKHALALVRNAIARSAIRKVAVAGGVFSNVKLNMEIAGLPAVEDMFVFPHMGDGGLALGAAMALNAERYGVVRYPLRDLYLGPAYGEDDVRTALEGKGFAFRRVEDIAAESARLILAGEIVLWFQGRMELGPRALGNRSILARPDDRRIKDRLNLVLKKRVWYQPFCPSMLMEDAPELLELDCRGDIESNRFMTTAFRVKERHLGLMAGVINVDGTCRPHLVGHENPLYRALLLAVKKELGKGVLLNTSLNIHGDPMVCSPQDALEMFERTAVKSLVMGHWLVRKTEA